MRRDTSSVIFRHFIDAVVESDLLAAEVDDKRRTVRRGGPVGERKLRWLTLERLSFDCSCANIIGFTGVERLAADNGLFFPKNFAVHSIGGVIVRKLLVDIVDGVSNTGGRGGPVGNFVRHCRAGGSIAVGGLADIDILAEENKGVVCDKNAEVCPARFIAVYQRDPLTGIVNAEALAGFGRVFGGFLGDAFFVGGRRLIEIAARVPGVEGVRSLSCQAAEGGVGLPCGAAVHAVFRAGDGFERNAV